MPSSAPSLPLASRFSKRSGSRESIQPCSRQMGPKHEVSLLTLCPLGQPKKAIGHESQIELWLTHAHRIRFACCASEIESSPHLSFPSSSIIAERSSPSRGRCAAPCGAPLTAPGRSEEHIPHKREREAWKHRQPAGLRQHHDPARMGTHSPLRGEISHAVLHHDPPAKREREGLDAKANFRPASARWGIISLDIPFYRTTGWADFFGSPKTARC